MVCFVLFGMSDRDRMTSSMLVSIVVFAVVGLASVNAQNVTCYACSSASSSWCGDPFSTSSANAAAGSTCTGTSCTKYSGSLSGVGMFALICISANECQHFKYGNLKPRIFFQTSSFSDPTEIVSILPDVWPRISVGVIWKCTFTGNEEKCVNKRALRSKA